MPRLGPVTAGKSDSNSSPEHPLAEDHPGPTPHDRHVSSDNESTSEQLDGKLKISVPNSNSSESSPNPVDSEDIPLVSDVDAADQPSNIELEELSTATSVNDDDRERTSSKINEHSENGNPDSSIKDNPNSGDSRKTNSRPRRISGQRDRQPGNSRSRSPQSPSPRPELICREVSTRWEIILLLPADEQWPAAVVHLDNEALGVADRKCHVPSLKGRLIVSLGGKKEYVVSLFDDEPLIFKLRKNWQGEGRRIARITNGYFIVIVPCEWQRAGHAPVEPAGCADPAFVAHFFHRDATTSDEDIGGFREWSGSLSTTGIELTGKHIFDDSGDGMLFVGAPPNLKLSPDIVWARVGEEIQNGWGKNFQPASSSLPEVLNGRQGRFFLRVYDSEARMLDSVAFRYLRALGRIDVNGVQYAQDTVLEPSSTGYPVTKILFAGADGSTLFPELPPQASQVVAPPGMIEVPPHPGEDCISCTLRLGSHKVKIVIDLPRIWWRIEQNHSDSGEWLDTPIAMTRKEFRDYAYANARISLLSKRFESIRAGFDDKPYQPYKRTKDKDHIEIPLDHFANYRQIEQRLNDDAHFNVELAGKIVSLVVISADPMPKVVSFTAEPSTIFSGQDATLEWATSNAGDLRVIIEPDMGIVESNGSCIVSPVETTRYKLILAIPGTEDISSTIMVVVDSSPEFGELPIARVRSFAHEWRNGKGFSIGELQSADLTLAEAADHSLRIDKRRKTAHSFNIEAIRSMLDA